MELAILTSVENLRYVKWKRKILMKRHGWYIVNGFILIGYLHAVTRLGVNSIVNDCNVKHKTMQTKLLTFHSQLATASAFKSPIQIA